MGITRVRHIGSGSQDGAASVSVTVPAAGVASGDCIVVWLQGEVVGTLTVTDSASNTYTINSKPNGTTNVFAAFAYCLNCNALTSGQTITASASAISNMEAEEYSGVATSSALDGSVTWAVGNSTAPNSGTLTTTNANDLLAGVIAVRGGTTSFTRTDSMTDQGNTGNNAADGEYVDSADQIVSSTGNYSCSATITSMAWVCGILALKAASGGGGTNWSKSVTDAISETDVSPWTLTKALLDAQSGTDKLQKQPGKAVSDYISALDSFTKSTGKSLSDAISEFDALSKASYKTFLDWVSEKDSVSLSHGYAISLSDKESALDGITRSITKGLVDNFSEIDQFSRVWTAHLQFLDSISQLDSLSKMPGKTFLEWISEVDSVTAQKLAGTNWVRTISDAHSALDVLLKTPGKWNSDAQSAVDVFSRVWTAHLTLQEWISEADTWAKSVVKSNQDSVSETDTFNRTVNYFRTFFDSMSETDKIAAGRLLLINLLDAASLTDQVSTLIIHPIGQFALAQVISLVAAQLGMTISLLVGTTISQVITNFATGPLSETISNF